MKRRQYDIFAAGGGLDRDLGPISGQKKFELPQDDSDDQVAERTEKDSMDESEINIANSQTDNAILEKLSMDRAQLEQ